MTRNNKPKIGISIGDLNGIGIEVVMKAFSDKRMFDHCTPIVYGSSKAMSYHKKALEMNDFQYNVVSGPEKAKQGALNVYNCWTEEVNIKLGHPDPDLGKFAYRALEAVNYDVSEGKIDAIITAPINKAHLSEEGKPFTGQTEFFAEKQKASSSLMFLVSEEMKVGLVTNHVPVKDVASKITTKKILEKLKVMNHSLQNDFMIERPKIAVLALNPHAGDGGIIGMEDTEIVAPAVAKAKDEKILAFGPYAADGFFGTSAFSNFDGILAMYHDQGLVPFKLLSFGHGVNFTAGLPIVRTSPDHGTAYNIAGQGVANEASFRQSVFAAADIYRNRKAFKEIKENGINKEKAVEEKKV